MGEDISNERLEIKTLQKQIHYSRALHRSAELQDKMLAQQKSFERAKESFSLVKLRLIQNTKKKNEPQQTVRYAQYLNNNLKNEGKQLKKEAKDLNSILEAVQEHFSIMKNEKAKLDFVSTKLKAAHAKNNLIRELGFEENIIDLAIIKKSISDKLNLRKSSPEDLKYEDRISQDFSDTTAGLIDIDACATFSGVASFLKIGSSLSDSARSAYSEDKQFKSFADHDAHLAVNELESLQNQREFFERIEAFKISNEENCSHVKLRYVSGSGGIFDVELRRSLDGKIDVAIRAHDKSDRFLIDATKSEIEKELSLSGISLREVVVIRE